jgi:eukaryotic-like serine/threonine-protein kinase
MSTGLIIRFFRMASVVMLLVSVALLSAITTMHFAIHGAEVKIPALKGMTVAEARSQAAGMGLNLDVDNRYYSADVAAGHILTPSPAPGTVVRREWHVRVAESLGPQKVDVPDTVGAEARVAALRLRRAGLEVGVTARLPWPDAQDGTVLAQDPPAHSQGIAQPSVNILVAAPDSALPDGYVMPDLTGVSVIAAQEMLTRIGLHADMPVYADVSVPSVGTGTEPPKPPVAPGSIILQHPSPGARVDRATLIKLTAAK